LDDPVVAIAARAAHVLDTRSGLPGEGAVFARVESGFAQTFRLSRSFAFG